SAILAIVRHEPLRQIILCLLEHDVCTVNDIVSLTHKAPSTVSVHLKHLKETGLVAVRRKEMCLSYCLVDRESVADVISKYRTSLVDKAVDNFVGMVEEL
ncbi:MAG: winged helix-turn-helix domain-containing protein, partial [Thermoproteota archaeon]